MHPAAQSQLDRVIDEYQRWMAVPEDQRSPAPGWWWGPAMALHGMAGSIPAGWSQRLGLAEGASAADAAQLLLDTLSGQTQLPWPEQFPRRYGPMPSGDAGAPQT
ncbi:MAG: hypothetical protein JWQ24_31 [Tardiphaga sp.]|nr:hypothetical protein [Tardiphaga sp.]